MREGDHKTVEAFLRNRPSACRSTKTDARRNLVALPQRGSRPPYELIEGPQWVPNAVSRPLSAIVPIRTDSAAGSGVLARELDDNERIQKRNNPAEHLSVQCSSAIRDPFIWSQCHRKSLKGKCRRGDLNFRDFHVSVTYRLY